ncbi:MAG: DUF2027 domain-containing protein [Muribaculum sp.]|nr:DUF2027 domain-containing protein [Muribaculaceae bacterium]MCM1080154.1 DUF2027 domain-containing protein [Muribaculum sp.]
MAQVGDIVRYLDSVGGGTIVRIDGQMAYVDEDGFETPVLLKQCVVVTPAKAQAPKKLVETTPTATQQSATAKPSVQETPGGDTLNIVLAYEADEPKHLNTTGFTAYLVNDSNYTLMLTYLTRSDQDNGWVTRFSGIIEPNMQEPLQTIEPRSAELTQMDRVCVQYVAFKTAGEFRLKSPVAVEFPLDTTKFFKTHCFRDSIYFDTPVIEYEIVKNDVPRRAVMIDSSLLEDALRTNKSAETSGRLKKPVASEQQPHVATKTIVEVDLHIHQLLDSISGLTNTDMLNVQLNEFNRVMKYYSKAKGQKIVFIHGKGEGVLRQALLKELKLKYKQCDVQDASFREYGFGATQVTIK